MQTKFLLAHKSFIVLKGLSAIINSLDFLASIRYCWSAEEFVSCIGEEEDDIVIAPRDFFDGVFVPTQMTALVLDHGDANGELAVLSWDDDQDTVISKIKNAVVQQKAIHDKDTTDELSAREKDIVTQVARGLTNQEIADTLFISTHTVITHRKNIVKKLGIKTVSGLTVYAILNNLIRMDEIELA